MGSVLRGIPPPTFAPASTSAGPSAFASVGAISRALAEQTMIGTNAFTVHPPFAKPVAAPAPGYHDTAPGSAMRMLGPARPRAGHYCTVPVTKALRITAPHCADWRYAPLSSEYLATMP